MVGAPARSSMARSGTSRGGYAMREALGGARRSCLRPKKSRGPGARLDVPITHINASYVRSHFDASRSASTMRPRADEIAARTCDDPGPRVHIAPAA